MSYLTLVENLSTSPVAFRIYITLRILALRSTVSYNLSYRKFYTNNAPALLKSGYFHKLCADVDTNSDAIMQDLLLVLSHLFGRRVCREIDDEEEAEKIKNSPSMVYLPPLPNEAADVLRNHNKHTLDIFTTYVKTFAAQYVKEEDRYLPLTKTPVGASPSNNSEAPEGIDFLPNLPAPHARSPFVALSGLGDEFKTIEDLCSSTREGVFLEAAVIPHLELHPDETRSPLNAYLLDFFKHGSVKPLEMANGIRKSDVCSHLTLNKPLANYKTRSGLFSMISLLSSQPYLLV